MDPEMQQRLAQLLGGSAQFAPPGGLPQGMPQGLPQGMPPGMPQGLPQFPPPQQPGGLMPGGQGGNGPFSDWRSDMQDWRSQRPTEFGQGQMLEWLKNRPQFPGGPGGGMWAQFANRPQMTGMPQGMPQMPSMPSMPQLPSGPIMQPQGGMQRPPLGQAPQRPQPMQRPMGQRAY